MANRVDLNQLRKIMLTNQDNDSPIPAQPAKKVYVGSEGDIRLGSETSPADTRKLSEVNQGTFYSAIARLSIHDIRRVILSNQGNNRPFPTCIERKVYVTVNGDVRLGRDVSLSETTKLSEVHQGTFYAYGDLRRSQDQVTATTKMPANTRARQVGNVFGYSYSITCAVGNQYTFFAYFDGTAYQVSLVSPSLEGQYGQHDAHLYSDGRLCLGEGGGMPTLESAYAKSVVWATGFSYVRQGYTFPFSNNN